VKAALAYLRRAMVPGKFLEAMEDFLIYEQLLPPEERVVAGRLIRKEHPPYPNTGRNKLVKVFLDTMPADVDRLIMVDDDNVFKSWQPSAVAALVDAVHHPIVSGLYFAFDAEQWKLRPLVMRRRPDGGYEYVWRYPEGMVEVDAIGMGFCCIHRSALEEWRASHGDTWFDFGQRPSGAFALEDESFCGRMQSIGKTIHVHTNLRIGHMKMAEIGEPRYVVPAKSEGSKV
jgi:hypothetical protein